MGHYENGIEVCTPIPFQHGQADPLGKEEYSLIFSQRSFKPAGTKNDLTVETLYISLSSYL